MFDLKYLKYLYFIKDLNTCSDGQEEHTLVSGNFKVFQVLTHLSPVRRLQVFFLLLLLPESESFFKETKLFFSVFYPLSSSSEVK